MARAKHILSLEIQGDLFYKRCAVCKDLKPFEQFSLLRNGSLRANCKPCGSKAARQYEIDNPEKVAAKKAQIYRKNIEKNRAYHAARYWSNPEAARAEASKWYYDNRDKIRDKINERTRLWKKNYKELKPEEYRKKAAEYRQRNRARSIAYVAKRYAQKAKATPDWANRKKVEEFYFAADLLGMVTGDWYHVDHIVPLHGPVATDGPFKGYRMVTGLHWEGNLRVIPRAENQEKSNRWWPDMP
jgi:hypothetical protein